VALSETDFIAIADRAANLSDYRSGEYFVADKTGADLRSRRQIDSWLAKTTDNPMHLRNNSVLPQWTVELRQMLSALSTLESRPRRSSIFASLCECGSRYGLYRLEKMLSTRLKTYLSRRATQHLANELQKRIVWTTKPCFSLELRAFILAKNAISSFERRPSAQILEREFLGEKPQDRLFRMFKRFPVLPRLWSQLICDWCDQVTEFLSRFEADRNAISRTFLGGRPTNKITDLRSGLSDPHNAGRAVILVHFHSGSVFYKPRPGNGESEWQKLVRFLNVHSFQPELRAASVLLREGYCWMERIEFSRCKNTTAANRFYRRLGGLMAAAYLTKTVDCHRENLIASGEYPILVDAETLWHSSGKAKHLTRVDVLRQTGFVPMSHRRLTWQYRSSILAAKTRPGQHTPRIGAEPLTAMNYDRKIIEGFAMAWQCILGTPKRRLDWAQCIRRIFTHDRRRIYYPTASYDAIRRKSIEPSFLRSGLRRDLFITQLCRRKGIPAAVVNRETRALSNLDIPYFVHKRNGTGIERKIAPPEAVLRAIRETLRW
jgi:lantibiotic modifying enzyme